MGYRLHASIPNVKEYKNVNLELGKQRSGKWDNFNYKWFGESSDQGFVEEDEMETFLNEMVEINEQEGRHQLYNIDILKEMMEYCKKNDYKIYFESW